MSRAPRRSHYGSLGASAIEYVPITSSPPPKKATALQQRRLARYGRRLATAFVPDALKFTPDAYAFGDVPSRKPVPTKRRQLSTGTLSSAQSQGAQVLRMLGDTTSPATGDSLVLQQILVESKNQSAWMERWVKKDELQRYIQIGATLAIPLAAAVWRMIFRAARGE